MFKKQEGITLVALVITIIVLLILAGVSISLVVGNNGVLTQASSAVNTNNIASAKQDVLMSVAGVYANYMGEWANNTALKFVSSSPYLTVDRLNANKTSDAAAFSGSTAEWTYTANNGTGLVVVFTVNDQGKVTFDSSKSKINNASLTDQQKATLTNN